MAMTDDDKATFEREATALVQRSVPTGSAFVRAPFVNEGDPYRVLVMRDDNREDYTVFDMRDVRRVGLVLAKGSLHQSGRQIEALRNELADVEARRRDLEALVAELEASS